MGNKNTDIVHHLRLALTPGLGPVLSRRLLELFGDPESVAHASINELKQVNGIGNQLASRIRRGHEAGPPGDQRGPGPALLIDGAEQDKWKGRVELAVLIGQMVANMLAPNFFELVANAHTFLSLLLSGMERRRGFLLCDVHCLVSATG